MENYYPNVVYDSSKLKSQPLSLAESALNDEQQKTIEGLHAKDIIGGNQG